MPPLDPRDTVRPIRYLDGRGPSSRSEIVGSELTSSMELTWVERETQRRRKVAKLDGLAPIEDTTELSSSEHRGRVLGLKPRR